MTKTMDTDAVPKLQDAIRELQALCSIPEAPRTIETRSRHAMIHRKLELLPCIQTYNKTPDHEYLTLLIDLRDNFAVRNPTIIESVTSMITEQMVAMYRKAGDLEVSDAIQCIIIY